MADDTTKFSDYVRQSEILAHGYLCIENRSIASEPLLNGVPYRHFREFTDVEVRREQGAFFTGEATATNIARQLMSCLSENSRVMDPTCGIGDLLLAYAGLLPIETTLHKTLVSWGRILHGCDLDPDFIRLTKARLIMLARIRGKFTGNISLPERYFSNIRCIDIRDASTTIGNMDGFLFNPPFGVVKKVDNYDWASGSVNSAALFLSELVKRKKPSAPISAILPEVLRCGTRYESCRQSLLAMGLSGSYLSLGRFDNWTDVDVFATLLTSSASDSLWIVEYEVTDGKMVKDYFDVRVGPVVPHRHPKKGPWRKFVCAKSTPRWSEGYNPSSSRRFKGTVFAPPFVVIRRTSSPSDRQRAVGSLVVGHNLVAVENHLLVLEAKDGSESTCRKLLAMLATQETTDFLNLAIRCRHLTTGVVGRIPWRAEDV